MAAAIHSQMMQWDMKHNPAARRGFSLIGLLVTMVLILILGMVLMNSLNVAVKGAGNTIPGSVASVKDEVSLRTLFMSMLAWSSDKGGAFIVPSEVDGSFDVTKNTTANLYSAMVAQNYTNPAQLISENERNPYVNEDYDYDRTAWSPAAKKYWDPNFKADLERCSNVSFAHLPLMGGRATTHWQNSKMESMFPILGTRGPKDGVENPQSYTYGRNGSWAGHRVYGDGHVEYVSSFTLPGGDNTFAIESGADGNDAVLAFTRSIAAHFVELQFD